MISIVHFPFYVETMPDFNKPYDDLAQCHPPSLGNVIARSNMEEVNHVPLAAGTSECPGNIICGCCVNAGVDVIIFHPNLDRRISKSLP